MLHLHRPDHAAGLACGAQISAYQGGDGVDVFVGVPHGDAPNDVKVVAVGKADGSRDGPTMSAHAGRTAAGR
jgi:hypothetical protein